MSVTIFGFLVFLAFVMEAVDSGLGMGFGTILSPLLIIMGWPPLVVVPSILLSQAVGGITASFFHQKYGNADFQPVWENFKNFRKNFGQLGLKKSCTACLSKDLKIVMLVAVFGVAASILGVVTAVKIPKDILKTYIGLLVIFMGVLIIFKKTNNFSWKKIFGLGLLSAFNKGLSGGGFGPVMTGGQIISGNTARSSIGTTTLSEAPICLVGFISYFLIKGLTSWNLLLALSVGAFFGGVRGPVLTKNTDPRRLRLIIGWLITFEGLWLLAQVLGHLSVGG